MNLHFLVGVGRETQPDSVCAVARPTHLPSVSPIRTTSSIDVVLEQLVTERIGLESGKDLSFSS